MSQPHYAADLVVGKPQHLQQTHSLISEADECAQLAAVAAMIIRRQHLKVCQIL